MILGAVYTAMAAGQMASWSQMPDILGAYRVLPAAALPWLAGALIAGELVAGVWLLARPRSHALAPVWVYTAVSVVWAALALQAQLRGLPVDNCGCFGVYLSQRLSWFVLAQDALLLGYAALLVRSARRATLTAQLAAGAGPEHTDATIHTNVRQRSTMLRAVFNDQVIAESDDTVTVEGNHYFPCESLRRQFFTASKTHTLCPWKGLASYYTVTVDGVSSRDAAWFYPHPSPLARKIKGRVAFWGGVQVQAVPTEESRGEEAVR